MNYLNEDLFENNIVILLKNLKQQFLKDREY
jgi:hypothetical protein